MGGLFKSRFLTHSHGLRDLQRLAMRLSPQAAVPKQSRQRDCQSRAWISSLASQRCWMVRLPPGSAYLPGVTRAITNKRNSKSSIEECVKPPRFSSQNCTEFNHLEGLYSLTLRSHQTAHDSPSPPQQYGWQSHVSFRASEDASSWRAWRHPGSQGPARTPGRPRPAQHCPH